MFWVFRWASREFLFINQISCNEVTYEVSIFLSSFSVIGTFGLYFQFYKTRFVLESTSNILWKHIELIFHKNSVQSLNAIFVSPSVLETCKLTGIIGGHPFSTYAKSFGKIAFLAPWYAHVRGLRTFFEKFCVRTKWMTPWVNINYHNYRIV